MADIVWWHSRKRIAISVVTSGVLAVAVALLAVAGWGQPAIVLAWLLVLTVLMQLRPIFYARMPRGREALRLATIVLFLIPIITIPVADPPDHNVFLSLAVGAVAGTLLMGFHIWDLRLLLNREIVALQPPMSLSGAAARMGYVLAVIPLEELFYRRLLTSTFLPVAGIVPAALIGIASFVYGDWSGSWGPNSRVKRLVAETLLASVTTLIYLTTGTIWGAILAHAIYNSSQLILPIRNLSVHRQVASRHEVNQ